MKFPDYKKYLQRLGRPGLIAIGMLCVVVIGSILFSGVFAKKEHAAGKAAEPPGVPVITASVTSETMPLQVSAIGNVEAYSTVAVRSQANGEITKVHFTQGQYVKKGDPLFSIDPRPSQADLAGSIANQSKAVSEQRQAEANMAKDLAQAKTAAVTAQRYEKLYQQGVVSKEQADQMRTNADALASVVKADQAAIASERDSVNAAKAAADASRVQLSYTSINSPIEGRTGSLMVNQGNLVKANDTNPLVVINQISPIYVSFAVPEAQLLDVKRYMAGGELQVAASIPNDTGAPEQGVLTFIDNAVDPATGTVKMKATFTNSSQRLWPGQFINILMTLAVQPDSIVVPSQALQTGQQGRYVFVVNSDQTVELRNVTVQRTAGEKTIIASGLTAGEIVVTDGQLRLRPGSKIKVSNDSAQPGKEDLHP
ncbi:MAG: efflux RND transporter periplasmic adaptor subunit [Blastocatellia bacterium]